MAENTEILELEIHIQDVVSELKRLDKVYFESGKNALNFQQKVANRKGYKEAQVNLQLLRQELNKTSKVVGSGGKGSATGNFAFFGQQLGYLASDARYGVLGIANNLSFLTTQFFDLSASAKKAGSSFSKEFLKSLRGPTGILIGVQLLIALLPEIIELYKKWTGQTDETAKALKELNRQTYELSKQIAEENDLVKERNDLRLRQINQSKDYLKIFGKVKKEDAEYLVQLGVINDASELTNLTYKEAYALLTKLSGSYADGTKTAKEYANAVLDVENAYKIADIRGETTASDKLSNRADIAIRKIVARTGLSYAEAAKKYWASNEGKLMSAKIQKAQDDALKKWLESDWGTEAEAIAHLKEGLRLEAEQKAFDDWLKGWIKLAKDKEDVFLDPEGTGYATDDLGFTNLDDLDPENDPILKKKILAGQLLREESERQKDFELQNDAAIYDAKQQLYNGLISLAQGFAGKSKGMAIALIALQKGLAIADVSVQTAKNVAGIRGAGALAEQNALAQLGPIAGPPVAATIKANTLKNIGLTKTVGALSIAAIAATGLGQIAQVSNSGGASSLGGASGVSRTPTFNIIGSGGTSQLANAIGNNVDQSDRKVVLLTSELDMEMNDQKVTIEQSSVG